MASKQKILTAFRYPSLDYRAGSVVLRLGPWRLYLTWAWRRGWALPRSVLKIKRAEWEA